MAAGKKIALGDIVKYEEDSGYILHSGSEHYEDAVVIQVAPLVLVSRGTDMRWQSTVKADKLKVVGTAPEDLFKACLRRLET